MDLLKLAQKKKLRLEQDYPYNVYNIFLLHKTSLKIKNIKSLTRVIRYKIRIYNAKKFAYLGGTVGRVVGALCLVPCATVPYAICSIPG
jgi:hypothetical protein